MLLLVEQRADPRYLRARHAQPERLDELVDAARSRPRTHRSPLGLYGLFFLAFALSLALVWVIDPSDVIGPWASWWLVVMPVVEVVGYLTDRDFQRHRGKPKPLRPVLFSAAVGFVTVPVVFVIALLDDEALGKAAVDALVCGAIIFVMGLGFFVLDARGQRKAERARAARS